MKKTVTDCLAQAQQAAAELALSASASDTVTARPAAGSDSLAAGGKSAAASLPKLVTRLEAMNDIVTKIYEALCAAPAMVDGQPPAAGSSVQA